MLLRQIKYFLAVADTGSFTAAAEECYISQSAVSQQIQVLEREIGAQLLRREGRRVSLTAAGEVFYKNGKRLLNQAEKLCRDTRAAAQPSGESLRIGYLKCYTGAQFRLALARFSERRPAVQVEIINGNHEDLYDALRTGGVDIILNDQRRAFSQAYVNKILAEMPCCAELAEHHPLAMRDRLNVNELRRFPCILVASENRREEEREYYEQIVGLTGEFIFAESVEQARLMVLGGKGYLPVEGPAREESAAPIARRELLRDGKPIRRNYCAFWKVENDNPYIEEFAELLYAQFIEQK